MSESSTTTTLLKGRRLWGLVLKLSSRPCPPLGPHWRRPNTLRTSHLKTKHRAQAMQLGGAYLFLLAVID
jgi:hypothetical protein